MKELLRKKSVKISILLITLLVVMGIIGINAWGARKSQEYKEHIAAAEKYLSELDYEQAIAEYTLAFEIDPKEEVVEALEQTYLAYAQTCIETGDYEKAIGILQEGYEKMGQERFPKVEEALEQTYLVYAETYIEIGDYEKAAGILQEGYKEIKWESLQKKTEEVTVLLTQKKEEEEKRASGMIEFPFRMSDIAVMGYNFSGNYLSQLLTLYPSEIDGYWIDDNKYKEGAGSTSDGGFEIYTDYHNGNEQRWIRFTRRDGGSWIYMENYNNGIFSGVDLYIDSASNGGKCEFGNGEVNVPVTAGESYEDWSRMMQVDQIKKYNLRPEERNGQVGIWKEDGSLLCSGSNYADSEHWTFSTEGGQGIYSEYIRDGYSALEFNFVITNYSVKEEWPIKRIRAEINNGVITRVVYQTW